MDNNIGGPNWDFTVFDVIPFILYAIVLLGFAIKLYLYAQTKVISLRRSKFEQSLAKYHNDSKYTIQRYWNGDALITDKTTGKTFKLEYPSSV